MKLTTICLTATILFSGIAGYTIVRHSWAIGDMSSAVKDSAASTLELQREIKRYRQMNDQLQILASQAEQVGRLCAMPKTSD